MSAAPDIDANRVAAADIPRSRHDAKYRAFGFTEYYCEHCLTAWFDDGPRDCLRCLRGDGVRVLEREA